MARARGIRSFRPEPAPDPHERRPYGPGVGAFRNVSPDAAGEPFNGAPINQRLIYLDDARASTCIERLAATQHGRTLISPLMRVRPDGVVGVYNAAHVMARISATWPKASLVDLNEGVAVDLDDGDIHPGQVVLVRGTIAAGTDVLPASLLVACNGGAIRLLVDRTVGLHLNQRYMTSRALYAVGIVHSVPRRQVKAVAICVAGSLGIGDNDRS